MDEEFTDLTQIDEMPALEEEIPVEWQWGTLAPKA